MIEGTKIVHAYFAKWGWKPVEGDGNQYMGVNFKASWIGDEIDAAAAKAILAARVEELELGIYLAIRHEEYKTADILKKRRDALLAGRDPECKPEPTANATTTFTVRAPS